MAKMMVSNEVLETSFTFARRTRWSDLSSLLRCTFCLIVSRSY